MLATAVAQLRFAAAILLGRPFALGALDRLVDDMAATRREFGSIGAEAGELLGGPSLDEATRRDVQLRRFRAQAKRAAGETAYYRRLFEQTGLDPGRLDLAALPPTRKEALRADPDAFVRRGATPVLRTTTTGTTGPPTGVCFSAYELRAIVALAAIGHLFEGTLAPDDVLQVNTSGRGLLGNLALAGAAARVGALVQMPGLVEPADALALLTQRRTIAGRKPRVSVLCTYPSYLGELVTIGERLGLGPADLGIERVLSGGEIVTAGLRERCRRLFGPIEVVEGYGMTEIYPLGGKLCSDGHLHFQPSQGLIEVLDPESGGPAGPGAAGTIVATPFLPYRETTLLLRYDTEDVVRPPVESARCRLRDLPATSNLLGKLRLSVRHDDGWTFPRDVLEAVEGIDAVPLPARCGFWAVSGGVAVEVVAPDAPGQRARIGDALEARGVPLRELHLRADRSELERPLPLRGDLREAAFGQSMPAREAAPPAPVSA
jgi:phenylacetate-CoA ligase